MGKVALKRPHETLRLPFFNSKLVLSAGREEINSKKFGPSVPPKDSNSLADAIENALLFSGEELARINSDAKEFIKNYDWNSVVKNILSLYEESVLNA